VQENTAKLHRIATGSVLSLDVIGDGLSFHSLMSREEGLTDTSDKAFPCGGDNTGLPLCFLQFQVFASIVRINRSHPFVGD
jgi:hypothetical protein